MALSSRFKPIRTLATAFDLILGRRGSAGEGECVGLPIPNQLLSPKSFGKAGVVSVFFLFWQLD